MQTSSYELQFGASLGHKMTTYIYCKPCNKLFNKELGCLDCLAIEASFIETHEPNEVTKAAMEEALNER